MRTARPPVIADEVSALRHLSAVLLLPLMNTVLIPAAILVLARDYRIATEAVTLLPAAGGAVLLAAGLSLVVRSIALFVRFGRGTLAPWDPTRALVTSGVYSLSRNPMKAGLFLILAGECLLSGSRALLVWAVAFVVVNVIYIRGFEERGLRQRFGAAFTAYCERVPRWIGPASFRRTALPSTGRTESAG